MSSFSLIENDERSPNADTLAKLAKNLNITADYLVSLTDDLYLPLPSDNLDLLAPYLHQIIENQPIPGEESMNVVRDMLKHLLVLPQLNQCYLSKA